MPTPQTGSGCSYGWHKAYITTVLLSVRVVCAWQCTCHDNAKRTATEDSCPPHTSAHLLAQEQVESVGQRRLLLQLRCTLRQLLQ